MKNRIMTTNIGRINLAELDLVEDSLEVFIPIVAVSENLKATIEENIQRAKAEHQKEILDCRGKKWSNAGIVMTYQSLHITVKDKVFNYELCFDFEDKESSLIFTDFSLEVDLSEHTEELKKLVIKAMIDKFF